MPRPRIPAGEVGAVQITGAITITAAADTWLIHVAGRAEAGSLAYSTLESEETTVRLTLKPACGGLTHDQLTVGHADRIIQGIFQGGSLSKARSGAGRARIDLRLGRA
jgi:hypothetical protein